jgi:hypothetical protein
MNEATIISILKAILPNIAEIVIDEYKPTAINWLNSKIADVENNIAKEKICILHATFGHGLWKDEGKLAIYEAELVGLNWALNEVNSFVVDQPTA